MKTFKQILTETRYRFYTEIRVFDDIGDDFIHDIYDDNSKTAEAQVKKAAKWVRKNLKDEEKVKLNVHDNDHPNGKGWIVLSKTIKP